jgi:hypothetical protein
MFVFNASGVKVGTVARRSGAENLVFSLMTTVRKALRSWKRAASGRKS